MNMHQKKLLPSAGEINAMMRKGMTQVEIASLFGVTPSSINVKLRRAGFAPIRGYGGVRVVTKRQPEQSASPSATNRTDRVVRVTPTGMRISLPRVTFIDGALA